MKYEPYHALINAIILQAVKNYRTALDDENTSGITECERFFRSDWFTFLTDVDGEIISLLCLTPRKSKKQSSSAILSGIRRSWQR